ncbi:hypothetical protein D3C75_1200090 [compost metagenome]
MLPVGVFLRYNKTLSAVFLAGFQLRSVSGPDAVNYCLYRHGVLNASLHTRHAANRIGVALADTGSPESIFLPFGQHSFHQKPVHGEQAWVPAC